MPSVLDFLYVFGARRGDDSEIRFGGFRAEKTLTNPEPALVIDALGRSGQRFQLCYNLKSVLVQDRTPADDQKPKWMIRQATVHHQLDVVTGNQLWIMGDPKAYLFKLMREHLHGQKDHSQKFGSFAQSFASSLDIHVAYAQWASEGWRWYIRSLDEDIQRLVSCTNLRNARFVN